MTVSKTVRRGSNPLDSEFIRTMKLINILNIVPNFLSNVVAELKKVTWLPRNNLVKFSIFVILVLVIGTLVILGFDKIFTEIRGVLILQNI